MLTITRKRDEEIVLDGDIVIKVIGISGSKVRLGIEAPREKRVARLPANSQSPQPARAPTQHKRG